MKAQKNNGYVFTFTLNEELKLFVKKTNQKVKDNFITSC